MQRTTAVVNDVANGHVDLKLGFLSFFGGVYFSFLKYTLKIYHIEQLNFLEDAFRIYRKFNKYLSNKYLTFNQINIHVHVELLTFNMYMCLYNVFYISI